jgi:hypothetical protein
MLAANLGLLSLARAIIVLTAVEKVQLSIYFRQGTAKSFVFRSLMPTRVPYAN